MMSAKMTAREIARDYGIAFGDAPQAAVLAG
jgi:hypothetical protein